MIIIKKKWQFFYNIFELYKTMNFNIYIINNIFYILYFCIEDISNSYNF